MVKVSSLAVRSPAATATTAELSTPPDRNAPSGTSAIRRLATMSSSQARSWVMASASAISCTAAVACQ